MEVSLMNTRIDIIAEISGKLSLVGYRDLRVIVTLAVGLDLSGMDDFHLGKLPKQQQAMTGRNPRTVAKALERVVDDIWKNGNKDALRRIYHRRRLPPFPPTPKNLIIRIVYYEKALIAAQRNLERSVTR